MTKTLQKSGPEPLWGDADLTERQRLASDHKWGPQKGGIEGDLGESSGLVTKEGITKSQIKAFFFPGQTNERALVIGGVHGSELSGIEVVNLLAKQMQDHFAATKAMPYYTTILVPELFPETAALARKHPSTAAGGDSNVGREIDVPNTKGGGKKTLFPARQYPELGQSRSTAEKTGLTTGGKPLVDKEKVQVPMLEETKALLQLIERFRPSRIASVHAHSFNDAKGATRGIDAPGIFVDPRRDAKDPTKEKTMQAEDDALALEMAKRAEKAGAQVPGNWLGDKTKGPETRYQVSSKPPAGQSLGDWGPVGVNEPGGGAGNRDPMTVITVEVRHYHESGGDAGRLKELQGHATALEEIFLGPPGAAAPASKPAATPAKVPVAP
jgi:hypothetical protein